MMGKCMSKNNVVAITAHPKFRSVAALRAYLEGSQEDFGTKITLEDFNSQDPMVQQMLHDLNEWCVGLQNLSTIADECEQKLKGGLKKGDFYNLAGFPVIAPAPLHHMSRNLPGRNTIHLTTKYKRYEEPKDDA